VQEDIIWLRAKRLKWLCVQFHVIVYINYAMEFEFLSQYVHYMWKCAEQENLLVALVTVNCVTLVYNHFLVRYMEQRFLLF